VTRKLIVVSFVLAAVIGVAFVLLLPPAQRTVLFSTAQAETNGATVKLRFYATNTTSRKLILEVCAVSRNDGFGWVVDIHALPTRPYEPLSGFAETLGSLEAREHKQLTFQVPSAPGKARLRVRVSSRATTIQKSRLAVSRWWANVRGRANHKRFWFSNLIDPNHEEVSGPETP
jgi:hypothetical protein